MEKLHWYGLAPVLLGAMLTMIAYAALITGVVWILLRVYNSFYGVSFQESIGKKLKFRLVLSMLSEYVKRDIFVVLLYTVTSLVLMYSTLVDDKSPIKVYMAVNIILFTIISVANNTYITKTDVSLLENDTYSLVAAFLIYACLFLVFDVVLKLGSDERPSLVKGRWDSAVIFIMPSIGGAIVSAVWNRLVAAKKGTAENQNKT